MIAFRMTGMCLTSESSSVSTGIVIAVTEIRSIATAYIYYAPASFRSTSLLPSPHTFQTAHHSLSDRPSSSHHYQEIEAPIPTRASTDNTFHRTHRLHYFPAETNAMASRQITLQIHHNTPRAALFMIWLEEAVKQTSGEVALLRADGKPFMNDVAAPQRRQRDRADSGVGLALTTSVSTGAVRR